VQTWWSKEPRPRKCLPYEIASISETKMISLLGSTPIASILAHHRHQLTRVYPAGARVGSSNIQHTLFLQCMHAGAQLICLNYQTYDAGQQVNRALFRLNGGCGYVLQKPILATPEQPYTPPNEAPDVAWDHYYAIPSSRRLGAPLKLHLRIVCAQHLPKPGEERIAADLWDQYDPQSLMPSQHRAPSLNSASNVYCTLEAWHAAPFAEGVKGGDAAADHFFKTKLVEGNGLNPEWDQLATDGGWAFARPNAAFVRLTVYHENLLRPQVIGSEVLPVIALRQGFRSVWLRTPRGLRLQLAAVLVHIQLESM